MFSACLPSEILTQRPDIRRQEAQLASATIHTIAIRARAHVPRKELEAIVKGAIGVMLSGSTHIA